jgi:hypothetical protein
MHDGRQTDVMMLARAGAGEAATARDRQALQRRRARAKEGDPCGAAFAPKPCVQLLIAMRLFLQVLAILSHVNQRIKALPALKLPLAELLALYNAPGAGPMVRNFALVYVERAMDRASQQQRFEQVMHARHPSAPPHACGAPALAAGAPWQATAG